MKAQTIFIFALLSLGALADGVLPSWLNDSKMIQLPHEFVIRGKRVNALKFPENPIQKTRHVQPGFLYKNGHFVKRGNPIPYEFESSSGSQWMSVRFGKDFGDSFSIYSDGGFSYKGVGGRIMAMQASPSPFLTVDNQKKSYFRLNEGIETSSGFADILHIDDTHVLLGRVGEKGRFLPYPEEFAKYERIDGELIFKLETRNGVREPYSFNPKAKTFEKWGEFKSKGDWLGSIPAEPVYSLMRGYYLPDKPSETKFNPETDLELRRALVQACRTKSARIAR